MNSASQKSPTDRPDFIFIGDHPAIDFVNTLVISDDQLTELLYGWSDVIHWLTQVGLAAETQLQIPAGDRIETLASVVNLRQTWKGEVETILAGGAVSGKFVEKLNQLLSADSFHEILKSAEAGLRLDRSPSQLTGGKLALALFARQISHFLADANMAYLHRCANTKSCVLYFYDTTKNHRRQWCSVDACGNRHKVAEFRRRKATKK